MPTTHGEQALTEADILGPSEAFRAPMDYYAHAPQTEATLLRLAQQSPQTLACMHGSAWRGDGAALLRALAASVTQAWRAPMPGCAAACSRFCSNTRATHRSPRTCSTT